MSRGTNRLFAAGGLAAGALPGVALAAVGDPQPDPLSVWWFFAGVGLLLVFVWITVAGLSARSREPRIRIVRRPAGAAPEDVRDGWIGVVLPVDSVAYSATRGPDVLKLPGESPAEVEPYYVVGAVALQKLAVVAPEAAEWYHLHAPQALSAEHRFAFQASDVEPIGPHQLTPGDLVGAELYDDGKNKRCSRCGLIQPSPALTCERCHGVFGDAGAES